jgi:REP element-mobilizing transposase RayT
MVTAGTYTKIPYFNTDARRDVLLKMLTDVTKEFGWRLQAWAVMANHYHFVASTERPERLGKMLGKLHVLCIMASPRLMFFHMPVGYRQNNLSVSAISRAARG